MFKSMFKLVDKNNICQHLLNYNKKSAISIITFLPVTSNAPLNNVTIQINIYHVKQESKEII